MKTSAMICVLAVVACASGAANNGDQAVSGRTDPTDGSTRYNVAAPKSSAWMYLPIAYSRLGLTIVKYDSASHVIEGQRLRSRADFDGKPLSALLNCGAATATASAPNAAQYDVSLKVTTTLTGNDTSSSIANLVHATAIGASNDSIPCTASALISDRVAGALTQAITEANQ